MHAAQRPPSPWICTHTSPTHNPSLCPYHATPHLHPTHHTTPATSPAGSPDTTQTHHYYTNYYFIQLSIRPAYNIQTLLFSAVVWEILWPEANSIPPHARVTIYMQMDQQRMPYITNGMQCYLDTFLFKFGSRLYMIMFHTKCERMFFQFFTIMTMTLLSIAAFISPSDSLGCRSSSSHTAMKLVRQKALSLTLTGE